EFLCPKVAIPMHYDTFDMIKADPQKFASAVGNTAKVVILKPGGFFEL
ncbi:MAG: metal-dependent hydrolase, partial [Thermotogae bacterium]|nr:metal-dependent hydrolase [Thermotogota bacterium]